MSLKGHKEEIPSEEEYESDDMENNETYRILSNVFERRFDKTIQNIPEVLCDINNTINDKFDKNNQLLDKRLKNIDTSIKKLCNSFDKIISIIEMNSRTSRQSRNECDGSENSD